MNTHFKKILFSLCILGAGNAHASLSPFFNKTKGLLISNPFSVALSVATFFNLAKLFKNQKHYKDKAEKRALEKELQKQKDFNAKIDTLKKNNNETLKNLKQNAENEIKTITDILEKDRTDDQKEHLKTFQAEKEAIELFLQGAPAIVEPTKEKKSLWKDILNIKSIISFMENGLSALLTKPLEAKFATETYEKLYGLYFYTPSQIETPLENVGKLISSSMKWVSKFCDLAFALASARLNLGTSPYEFLTDKTIDSKIKISFVVSGLLKGSMDWLADFAFDKALGASNFKVSKYTEGLIKGMGGFVTSKMVEKAHEYLIKKINFFNSSSTNEDTKEMGKNTQKAAEKCIELLDASLTWYNAVKK